MELFDSKYVHFMWDDSLEGKEGFVHESIMGLKSDINQTRAVFTTTVRKSDDDTFVSNNSNRKYPFFYYDPNYKCKRAYVEGKQLQLSFNGTTWVDIEPDWEIGDFDKTPADYRIKPEEKVYVFLKKYENGTSILAYTESPAIDDYVYFTGTKTECLNYIEAHRNMAPIMKAWEDGKPIQARLKNTCDWYEAENPEWSDDCEYRIKPEEPKSKRMTFKMLCEWLNKGQGQYRLGENAYIHEYYNITDDNKELPDEYKIRRWGSDEWIEPTVDVYEADCHPESLKEGEW